MSFLLLGHHVVRAWVSMDPITQSVRMPKNMLRALKSWPAPTWGCPLITPNCHMFMWKMMINHKRFNVWGYQGLRGGLVRGLIDVLKHHDLGCELPAVFGGEVASSFRHLRRVAKLWLKHQSTTTTITSLQLKTSSQWADKPTRCDLPPSGCSLRAGYGTKNGNGLTDDFIGISADILELASTWAPWRGGGNETYMNMYVYTYPIGSMYGIYANIWGILMVNVTIYSIHGSYGYIYIIYIYIYMNHGLNFRRINVDELVYWHNSRRWHPAARCRERARCIQCILIAMVGEIGQGHKENHRTQQGAREAHLHLGQSSICEVGCWATLKHIREISLMTRMITFTKCVTLWNAGKTHQPPYQGFDRQHSFEG